MNFDENTHIERFYGKKIKLKNLTIYPYYEIKILKLTKILNTKIDILALIIESNKQDTEYSIHYLNKKAKKYEKEIINKFKLEQLWRQWNILFTS